MVVSHIKQVYAPYSKSPVHGGDDYGFDEDVQKQLAKIRAAREQEGIAAAEAKPAAPMPTFHAIPQDVQSKLEHEAKLRAEQATLQNELLTSLRMQRTTSARQPKISQANEVKQISPAIQSIYKALDEAQTEAKADLAKHGIPQTAITSALANDGSISEQSIKIRNPTVSYKKIAHAINFYNTVHYVRQNMNNATNNVEAIRCFTNVKFAPEYPPTRNLIEKVERILSSLGSTIHNLIFGKPKPAPTEKLVNLQNSITKKSNHASPSSTPTLSPAATPTSSPAATQPPSRSSTFSGKSAVVR